MKIHMEIFITLVGAVACFMPPAIDILIYFRSWILNHRAQSTPKETIDKFSFSLPKEVIIEECIIAVKFMQIPTIYIGFILSNLDLCCG